MEPPKEVRWMGNLSQRVAMLALTTRNISPDKENLAHIVLSHFAGRLDSLAFLLKEMQRDSEVHSGEYGGRLETLLKDEIAILETFLDDYAGKCNLFLLSSCSDLTKQLLTSSKHLTEALDLVLPRAGTTALKLRIAQVKEGFETGSPKLDAKQQAILDTLEPVMLDSIVADAARSEKLVQQIAETLDYSVEGELFEAEVRKMKADKEKVENGKGKAYTLYLDQVVSLLEKGILAKSKAASTPSKANSLSREVTMRSTPLTPLQSFICPITRDVMRDPVQIASGQTYEREAIERWFQDGHTRCPMGDELKNTKMKSNIALRQSIAEWRELNYGIRIENARGKLQSNSTEDQEVAVLELQRICEEDIMNKYTITTKGLLVPLIRLAEKQNFELRKKTFAALKTLAEENDENQEIMVKEGIIDIIVRCLARRYGESEAAVLLLRLLSGKPSSAEKISHAHGAVLLLVMLLGSEHEDIVANVRAILENLPTSDENVVIMAEANLMKPLLARLVEGSTASKIAMAKTLAQLQMPDASKVQTATEESIGTLLQMTMSYNEEERESAVGALENLAGVKHACTLMTKAQPSGQEIMMPLITSNRTTSNVKVVAARVIARIMTCMGHKWEPVDVREEQIEWLVCSFLQLLHPFAPADVHAQVLLGLLGIAAGADSGHLAKKMMKEKEGFSLLAPFVKPNMDQEVRKNSVKLFASLSGSYGAEALLAIKEPPMSISHIVDILKKDTRMDSEQVAAVSILANLPTDDLWVKTELLQLDCIPLLVKFLNNRHTKMQEAAAGALLRFTSPSLPDLQLKLASSGAIQRYVNLLDSLSSLTKERAARALANFSRSSSTLTKQIPPKGCFSCMATPVEVCDLHGGECAIETSFCLKKADAVVPLLSVMKEREPRPCEASFAALLTLVGEDVESHEPGCHLIAKAKGVPVIVNLLNVGTQDAQYMAVVLLEKIFRIQQYRQQYGALAQMHIITVAQKGSNKSKQVAGKILRQMDLLHSQSHYFASSTM